MLVSLLPISAFFVPLAVITSVTRRKVKQEISYMQENEQEKSPIKQRILLFLANKGISPYEFYKNSGVTRGILAQNNGISEDNLNRFISYFPTVNLVWLMSGCGDMEIKADSTAGIVDIQNKQQEISPMHNPTSLADDLVARHKPQLLPV